MREYEYKWQCLAANNRDLLVFSLLFLQIRLNGFYLFTDHLNSTFITFFLLLFFPLFAIFIKMRIKWLVTMIISLQRLPYETDC